MPSRTAETATKKRKLDVHEKGKKKVRDERYVQHTVFLSTTVSLIHAFLHSWQCTSCKRNVSGVMICCDSCETWVCEKCGRQQMEWHCGNCSFDDDDTICYRCQCLYHADADDANDWIGCEEKCSHWLCPTCGFEESQFTCVKCKKQ